MDRTSTAVTRSLTFRYLAALIAIAAACLVSQGVIQSLLHAVQTDAAVVNVSGRQRMLSQRIAKLVYRLAANPDPDVRIALIADLDSSVKTFGDMHQSLQLGDQLGGIPQLSADGIRRELASVEPLIFKITKISTEVTNLAAQGRYSSVDAQRLADEFETAENEFLKKMERVVEEIAVQSRRKIERLIWAERAVTAVTLLLLGMVAIFVFRPVVKSVGKSFQDLANALQETLKSNSVAGNAVSERNIALTAAASDLKRLANQIDSLLLSQVLQSSQGNGQQFKMLMHQVQATLTGLTELGGGDGAHDRLLVSRFSPRRLIVDAVERFVNEYAGQKSEVGLTFDDRLPASLLVDGHLFSESIVHALKAISEATSGQLAVHVGYDDRLFRLAIDLYEAHPDFLAGNSHSRKRSSPVQGVSSIDPIPETLDLLLAKRLVSRIGGVITACPSTTGLSIQIPLDETRRMNHFMEVDSVALTAC